MNQLLKRLPTIFKNRWEKLFQKIIGRRFDVLLQSAYVDKEGKERSLIQTMAKIDYGVIEGDVKKARRFLRNIYYAEERLFAKGAIFKLGHWSVGLERPLYIHCRSISSVESSIYLRGFYYEITVLEEYQSHVKPGTTAIDIGANIGIHTLAFSRYVGKEGKVYAYEPRRELCKDIEENLQLNEGAENVVIRGCGVGKAREKIPFNDKGQFFNQGAGGYDPFSDTKIDIVSLDEDLFHESLPISFIKIDVEGMEYEVILGAKELIKKWRPTLCIEYNSPPWKLGDLVKAIGYPVKILRIPNSYREKVREVAIDEPLLGINNLLIQPD